MIDLISNVIFPVIVLAGIVANAREHSALRCTLTLLSLSFAAIIISLAFPIDAFGKTRVLAWFVFLYVPLYLIGVGILGVRKGRRRFSGFVFSTAGLILIIGCDSFLIEPHQLEITSYRIAHDSIRKSVRIALVADIQTDSPGPYERGVFESIRNGQADLVLFAGDYIHERTPDRYRTSANRLRAMIQQIDLRPRFGAYAIAGNVDPARTWRSIFQNTGIEVLERRTRLDLGPIVLTALPLPDSLYISTRVTREEKFHLVIGHSPNFSLGQIDANLLLAGHTHGGQFQLPVLGPLVTLSAVPRGWAHGITEIGPEKWLIVSRGIGMERGNAPRLRFLCRPEVVFIDLVPTQAEQVE